MKPFIALVLAALVGGLVYCHLRIVKLEEQVAAQPAPAPVLAQGPSKEEILAIVRELPELQPAKTSSVEGDGVPLPLHQRVSNLELNLEAVSKLQAKIMDIIGDMTRAMSTIKEWMDTR